MLKRTNKKKNDSKTYAEYINYLGQYANYPAESFSSAAENIFTSEELTAWEERLRIDKDFDFYVDGMLELDDTGRIQFKSNERLSKEGKKFMIILLEFLVGLMKILMDVLDDGFLQNMMKTILNTVYEKKFL